jgi:hypothetical protein
MAEGGHAARGIVVALLARLACPTVIGKGGAA